MKQSYSSALLAAWLLVLISGCAGHKKEIAFEEVPNPANDVIQAQTADGKIDKIVKKNEEGEVSYQVEYRKNDREYELTVSDSGEIKEIEEMMKMEELPPVVRTTVEKESAGGKIEELVREFEDGKTFYEVEFEKDGKEHEVKIGLDGTVLERE